MFKIQTNIFFGFWLSVLAFLMLSQNANAGTRILQYGFEDASPYAAGSTASPGAGWPFASVSSTYWGYFTNGTNVVNSIGSIVPHSANNNNFFARQYCTTKYDPYIGKTPTSIDAHINIGYGNHPYPTGTHDTINFQSINSDTVTIRYWFALYGNWTSTQTAINGDGNPVSIDSAGMKFIRVYANSEAEIGIMALKNHGDEDITWHHSDPGGVWQTGVYYPVGAVINNDNKNWTALVANTATVDDEPGVGTNYATYWATDGIYHSTWGAYNNPDGAPDWQTGTNIKNGWHSFAYKVQRVSDISSWHNYKIDAYWDDWDMTGTQGYHWSGYITIDQATSNFSYTNIAVNWGAVYPQDSMGIAFDDFEVWDGTPNESNDTLAPLAPSGLNIS